MNNNEQPQQEEDLFDRGENHQTPKTEIKFASPDDGLGWECKQCELFGRTCPECSAKQKAEQSNIVPIQGHQPKSGEEIPLEEAIESMNEFRKKLSGGQAS